MGLGRVSWAVLGVMLVAGCVEPQPQTLTLPRADDQNKKVRQAMVEFNEARFQEECTAIDLAVAMTGLPAETLPGGVLLQHGTKAPAMQEGLKGWQAARGDRVHWAWEAYTLDGALLTSGVDEFEVERGGLGLRCSGCTRRDLTVHAGAPPRASNSIRARHRVVGRSAARCFGRSFLA